MKEAIDQSGRTKIPWSKFEDLSGFIKQLENQAASLLANRRELPRAVVPNGRFLWGKEWDKEVINKRKDWSRQEHLPSGAGAGVSSCRVLYLPLGVDEEDPQGRLHLPDRPLKTIFLGEVETTVRLGVKSLFQDLASVTPC